VSGKERKATEPQERERRRGGMGVSTSHELREHYDFKGLLDFQL
jgi:hypothetical protein